MVKFPLFSRRRRCDDSREHFEAEVGVGGNSVAGAIVAIVLFVVIIAFIIVCIVALVQSFVCFGKSGTTTDKVLGVVVAWLTGPFFWLYKHLKPEYCREKLPAIFAWAAR